MYTDVLPAYMSEYHVRAWCLQRPEEGIGVCVSVLKLQTLSL